MAACLMVGLTGCSDFLDILPMNEVVLENYWTEKNDVLSGFAAKNDIIHQLIDLALLQNGMLKGEALDKFLKRSVDLIK